MVQKIGRSDTTPWTSAPDTDRVAVEGRSEEVPVGRIVTLTMNPAIDLATRVERVVPTDKMRCATPRFDPGGGGINVARTAAELGVEVTAIFPTGGPSGRLLEQLVRDAGVPPRPVRVAESTRESLSVTETTSGEQYRFVFPGPRLTDPEQHRCLAEVERAVSGGSYLVASGTLPPGVSSGFYQTLTDLAGDLGVRVVLDTSGIALRGVHRGVYLIKPSVRELSDYVGHPLIDRTEQLSQARRLIDAGMTEIVLLSLGAAGALVVTRDSHEWFASIPARVRSGIGAGDAMVGGTTVGLTQGYELADAVRLGIAAATAALATTGTCPGRREHIAELYRELLRDDGSGSTTDDLSQPDGPAAAITTPSAPSRNRGRV
ncbi:1-phosphofructokinase family hexose kinase [Nocardia asiatica]|uniref:1-phosphofructokinase family hexose kinase n=1 Tax=Nocardia asiatica TaxID=209252 RepID=UPI0002F9C0D1|nr:1-phosphofructokinase family hexose kinase [Nocardia asiatica]